MWVRGPSPCAGCLFPTAAPGREERTWTVAGKVCVFPPVLLGPRVWHSYKSLTLSDFSTPPDHFCQGARGSSIATFSGNRSPSLIFPLRPLLPANTCSAVWWVAAPGRPGSGVWGCERLLPFGLGARPQLRTQARAVSDHSSLFPPDCCVSTCMRAALSVASVSTAQSGHVRGGVPAPHTLLPATSCSRSPESSLQQRSWCPPWFP